MDTLTDPRARDAAVGDVEQLDRLLALRRQIERERCAAATPAVERALQMADYALCMALGYFGHGEQLFPEQTD